MKKMFLGLAMLAVFNVFNAFSSHVTLRTKFWFYEVKNGLLTSKIVDEAYNQSDWDFSDVKQVRGLDSKIDTIAVVVRAWPTQGDSLYSGDSDTILAPKIKVTTNIFDNSGTEILVRKPFGGTDSLLNFQYNRDFSVNDWKELKNLKDLPTNDEKIFTFLSDTNSYQFDAGRSQSQFYAAYLISVSNIAELNLKVEVDWNETWYNDQTIGKRAPKDKKTIFEFDLAKTDKLASINSLAELHLINAHVDTVPSGQYSTDFGEDLISGFSPDKTNYVAKAWEHVKTPTLFFKPLRHGVTVEVKYKGAGVFNGGDKKVISSTWDWVYLPTIGGDVEIIVTAQNGISVKTYKLSYKQLLNETPELVLPDTLKTKLQDVIKTHLLEYLYVKDGNDTVKLYSKKTGRLFDGSIKADDGENTFIASVPDPNNLDIQLLSKFLSRYEYDAVTRDKAKVVWEKKTSSEGEVSLDVSVKKPSHQTNLYDTTYYQIHQYDSTKTLINAFFTNNNTLDSIEKFRKAVDSLLSEVRYTIKLLPNSANLKGIKFRYDSITAPDVTVDYNPDSTDYKEFLLPTNIKRLFIYAEPVDPKVKPTLKFGSYAFEPIDGTIGGVKYPGWHRLKSNSVIEATQLEDGYNLLTINVTAQDSITQNDYVVYFKKAYDLNLTSLDVLFKNGSLFEAKLTDAQLKTTNTYSVSLPADFVIENLGDIKVDAVHPTPRFVSVKHYIEAVGQDYKVNIIVRSQDQVKYYYVNLKTAKAITTLNNLFTSTGTLSPAFSPNVREYDLSVPEGTESVTFYSVLTDELAKVTNPLTVNTPTGTTVVTLEITASNGTTKGSYIINVLNGEVPTGISKVNVKNLVTSNNGVITVSNDFNERVYIISSLGKVITSFDKKAGSASIRFNQKGVYILNGTSGWVTKVALH